MLGVAPGLGGIVADRAGIFSTADRRRLSRELNEFHLTFPQLRLTVVSVKEVPKEISLGVYSFWLFNRSDVVRQMDAEGRNRDLLLTLCPIHHRAALMVGYGLEPFVGARHLDAVLAAGSSFFQARQFAAGVLTVLDAMHSTFKALAEGIPRAFALSEPPEPLARSMAEVALDY